MPVLAALGRMSVGAVLLVALADKLVSARVESSGLVRGVGAFADLIQKHSLIPARFAFAAALLAMISEAVIGLWLFTHMKPRAAALSAAVLLGIFSTYLVLVHIHQRDVNCGCFGTLSGGTLIESLVRNGILVGLLVPTWILRERFEISELPLAQER